MIAIVFLVVIHMLITKVIKKIFFTKKKIVLTGKDVLYKHDSIDNTIDYLEEKFGMIIYLYIKKFVQRIDCHGRVFIN